MRRRLRLAMAVVLGVVLIALVGVIYVRTVGSDPDLWHVDPAMAARTGKPNDALVLPGGRPPADMASPVIAAEPEALARRFHEIVMNAPRTEVLAGGPETGLTTYIQRSRWVGWPDYISVKATPAEGGAALAIWSRARFGYSDLGVNRDRVDRWLAALQAQD